MGRPRKDAAPVVTAADSKKKALATTIEMIEKRYGKGSIMQLGSGTEEMMIERLPTGSLALDIALGGGIPKGRIGQLLTTEVVSMRGLLKVLI